MNPSSRLSISSMALIACLAGATFVGAAIAQPVPGGIGPGGPGPGPGAPSPLVDFRICNKSTDIETIFAAIVSSASAGYRAQGWTQVPRGQCISTGKWPRPRVWYHARSANGVTWSGRKNVLVDLCVDLNRSFDVTWSGSTRDCSQGETLVRFTEIDIPATAPAYDITLE